MQSIEEYIASQSPPPAAAASPTPSAWVEPAVKGSDPVWVETPPVEYLPGGISLRLTLRRRLVIAELAGNEWGLVDLPFPIPFSEIVLYLAAHQRAAWERPVQDPETGATQPLHRVPALLATAARDWLDATFRHGELSPMSIVMMAASLWDYHESPRVSAEKKTLTATPSEPSPIPTTNGSGSSLEETSAAGTTSSTTSPSGTSTPPSTLGSAPRESPASAPAPQPQPAPTSTADSPPSGSEF
jgi:hypothetical protein